MSMFRDFSLKLLALAVAALLWLSVNDDRLIERGFEVPLEFENLPRTLSIGGDPPDAVRVRLRGPADAMGGVAADEVAAVLDLSGHRPGAYAFDMLADRVRIPPGVEVTNVAPDTVHLTLEPSAGAP